jgi:hypothetical protein
MIHTVATSQTSRNMEENFKDMSTLLFQIVLQALPIKMPKADWCMHGMLYNHLDLYTTHTALENKEQHAQLNGALHTWNVKVMTLIQYTLKSRYKQLNKQYKTDSLAVLASNIRLQSTSEYLVDDATAVMRVAIGHFIVTLRQSKGHVNELFWLHEGKS